MSGVRPILPPTRAVCAAAVIGLTALAAAQSPQFAQGVRDYVKVDAPVVAITNVRVIDGTGAPAREEQTVVIRDGNIAALGDAAARCASDGATAIDGTGKTIMPGPGDAARASLLSDRPATSTGSSGRASRGSTSPAA